MSVTFVASAKGPTAFPGATNNTSTCLILKPTGTVDDDLMIAFIQAGNVTISAPAGWTQLNIKQSATTNLTSTVFYRKAASEGANYTFTDSSGDTTPLQGAIATFRGQDLSAPMNIDGGVLSPSGTDPGTTPTVVSTSNCLMLHYRTGKTATVASQGVFTGTGLTNRFSVANRGGSTQYYSELYTNANVNVSAGSQPGVSFDGSLTITGSVERQIGIKSGQTTVVGADTPPPAADAAVVSAIIPAADTAAAPAADTGVSANQALVGETPAAAADTAGLKLYAAETGSFGESIKVVANGAILAFGTDALNGAETAAVKVTAADPATSQDLADIGYQGLLPRGPRIYRIPKEH